MWCLKCFPHGCLRNRTLDHMLVHVGGGGANCAIHPLRGPDCPLLDYYAKR